MNSIYKREPIQACVLGNNGCRQGYIIKYFRIPRFSLEIEHAKSENRYAKLMTGLQKVKLLILDYIGLKSYSLDESRDILEIAEIRHSQGSTILAGQIPHTK